MLFNRRWILCSLLPLSLFSTTATWNVDANGNWGTNTNWTPNTLPNAIGDTAIFGNVISTARTVSLDISPIVGTISIDSGQTYLIAQTGSNSLTLQVSSNNAAITITNVNGNGAHTISAPLTLASPLTITQGSASVFTVSGLISGSQAVTIAGTGTTVFSGANNYSGGTTISASSTLQTATSSIQGNITNNGTLIFNQTSSGTFGGNITGSGSLSIQNTGTVILTGTNTYSGTTTVATGATLQGSTTALPGAITNNGTVIFNQGASATYGFVISGTGSVTMQGNGVLTLNAANTYNGGTTISSGTLQVGVANALLSTGAVTVSSGGILDLNSISSTIGSLSGAGSITLETATLTTNASSPASSTFSGVIYGLGGFVQAGSSTLIFSNTNQYSGGTTVSNGVLQLGIASALPPGGALTVTTPGSVNLAGFNQSIGALSGSGAIALGSAQLTVTQTTTTTYSGVMSQAGSLIFAGTGTLILQGSNSFTGGTFITGGTLQLGADNALAATGAVDVSSGATFSLNNYNQTIGSLSDAGTVSLGSAALTVNTTGSSTFSGTLTGTGGALAVAGSGTLILTGTSSYTGGTTVSDSSTLQGNTTSLQGNISNNAHLIFNQTTNGTFVGTLSGTGALTINGSAQLALSGTQTQGSTTVTSGTLFLNTGTTLTSPTVTIASGSTLAGTATIIGDVTCNGLLDPQNPNGTVTITGNYIQGANSSLELTLLPSSIDQIAVSGTITLGSGASVLVNPTSGFYTTNTLYTFMTAGSTVSGTFSSTVDLLNPFFRGTLIYNETAPGSVQLKLTLLPLSDVITGGNPGSVARCLNPNTLPTTSGLYSIIQNLIFLPLDEVRGALDQMQPSAFKALTLAEESNFILMRTSLSNRLEDLAATAIQQHISKDHFLNVWVSGTGDLVSQSSLQDNVGFKTTTGAASLGIDTKISSYSFVGLWGGYQNTALTWEKNRGHGNTHGYYGGPYLSLFNEGFYLNIAALGGWTTYHTNRHIVFSVYDEHALSSHTGYGFDSHLDVALLFYPGYKKGDKISLTEEKKELVLSPFIGIDYLYLKEQGYKEHEADSFNLRIDSTQGDLLRTEAGLKLTNCSSHLKVKWIQNLKVSWVYERRSNNEEYTAGFLEEECTFTVRGMRPTRSLFDVAFGLTGSFWEDKISCTARYEGLFGKQVANQSISLQGVFKF